MEAAVVSLPLPLQHHNPHVHVLASLPPHHNHCRGTLSIPIPRTNTSVYSAASSKPTAAARVTTPAGSTHAAAGALCSSRAATGYAAALADACVRAGTLRRAFRHARALLLSLRRRQQSSSSHHSHQEVKEDMEDARVAALVRMLLGKGKAAMVAEVMAEFAAICDHLLPRPAAPRAQSHHVGVAYY